MLTSSNHDHRLYYKQNKQQPNSKFEKLPVLNYSSSRHTNENFRSYLQKKVQFSKKKPQLSLPRPVINIPRRERIYLDRKNALAAAVAHLSIPVGTFRNIPGYSLENALLYSLSDLYIAIYLTINKTRCRAHTGRYSNPSCYLIYPRRSEREKKGRPSGAITSIFRAHQPSSSSGP